MSDNADKQLFTCLSCSIAFLSAENQRIHYRSDHHRYNMKRRVASLPPVSAAVFDQKVLDRRAETAVMASPKGSTCEICNKVYTTENAYRSHLLSKKHKETQLKVVSKLSPSNTSDDVATNMTVPPINPPPSEETETRPVSLAVNDDATEDEENQTIDEKIAAARSRVSVNGCLFCLQENTSLEDNLNHMSSIHSFFIPDADYLVDITGLILYLGEKIAVGNVCIYCNGKGRELKTLEAVRKHMVDKSHCKIAYESSDEKLEISDYYDFTSSYPNPHTEEKRTRPNGNDEIWEDVDDHDGEVDEVFNVDISEDESVTGSDDSLPDNQITYGDSPLELVLPSGARIGHRTMRRYYAQSFPSTPRGGKPEDLNSGSALVRRLLADKNSALVPRKGGYGAFGAGTEVVKARNRGEAREAGRHIREFREQKRREDFKTKVGFIHNSQKHFRDPLLQ